MKPSSYSEQTDRKHILLQRPKQAHGVCLSSFRLLIRELWAFTPMQDRGGPLSEVWRIMTTPQKLPSSSLTRIFELSTMEDPHQYLVITRCWEEFLPPPTTVVLEKPGGL